MQLKKIIVAVFILGCAKANAQSFAINTTGTSAHHSAMLDITSTSKGVLVPRLSTAQRIAIAIPAKGLMVYDSTLNQFAYYDGAAWQLLYAGVSSWTVSGSNQYSSLSGNVGIGTATPSNKLQVAGKTATINFQMTNGASAGHVLQSDALGNASWVNPTALTVSETDPQVSSATTNYLPKWNGSTLIDGVIFDDGSNVGIGTSAPTGKLHVVGNLKVENGKISIENSSNSVYIGNNCGTGDNLSVVLGNTAIGTNSMVSNVSGYSNTAVGYEAMRLNNVVGGAENTVVGAWAFRNNTTGVDNAILGSGAGMNNIGGSRNTFVGRFAGRNNTGSNNVFLGNRAGHDETGSDKLYISNSSTTAPLIYGDFANHLLKVNGTLNVNDAYNLPTIAGTANQVLQTNGAGQANWVNASSLTITELDPQVSSATTNKVPKWNGTTLTDGLITDNGTNIGIGTTAPTAKLHIKGLAAIDSGRIEFINTGNSVLIGEDAGASDNRTDNRNVFVGAFAGQSISNGNNNIAIGYESMMASSPLVTGNVAIGTGTLTNNGNGGNNVAIGLNAGNSISGNANIVIGPSAGRFANQSNIIIGAGAYASGSSTGFGNVMIGTSAGAIATGNNNIFIGSNAGFGETGNDKLIIDNITGGTPLIYGDFSAEIVTVNGNLGIGTTTPTQAKLVVNGSESQTFASYGYLNRTHPTGTINSNTTANDYSIYATDRIAAPEFNAFSDERIKKVLGKTNNAEDLQTINTIEIVNYKLRDSIGKGNKLYKKVIAQQVEKVYPLAVSKMTDVIPDIYQPAAIKNGTIQLSNTLKVGDKVKLIFASGEEMATVTAATAASFTVNNSKTGKVFVYGRAVSDFRSVDYEAISMLNVSATQQLVKEMEQQKVQINQQQQQINQLITELKKLKQSLPVSSGGAL